MRNLMLFLLTATAQATTCSGSECPDPGKCERGQAAQDLAKAQCEAGGCSVGPGDPCCWIGGQCKLDKQGCPTGFAPGECRICSQVPWVAGNPLDQELP